MYKTYFLSGSCQPLTRKAESGTGSISQWYYGGTDPRIRIHRFNTKMSRSRSHNSLNFCCFASMSNKRKHTFFRFEANCETRTFSPFFKRKQKQTAYSIHNISWREGMPKAGAARKICAMATGGLVCGAGLVRKRQEIS
jgi:hypothetical protein